MAVSESATVTINAAPEDVLAIVRDIDSQASWFPGCLSAELVDSDADGMPVRGKIVNDVKVAKDEFELDYTNTADSISWTLNAPSKAQKSQSGSWTVVADGSGSKATLSLTVDSALKLPGFIQKKAIKDTVKNATEALKKKAEA